VDPAAQNLGIWALVLSLLGFLCCPPIIPSIIGIVLGVKAKNRGATALGIAGLVIGIIGLLIYIPVVLLMIFGLLAAPGAAPHPSATSWLWGVQWLLG